MPAARASLRPLPLTLERIAGSVTEGNSTDVRKAVILARGLGTRMRRPDPAAALDAEQAALADEGMKAMIPVGRPFLDYVLSALADAGIADVCLVIGPEHQRIREYYARTVQPRRLRIHFAVQERPAGTADALLAAEPFIAGDAFLVLNADNYYPVDVLAGLRRQPAPALPAFERKALSADGNIPPERIARYALLEIAPDGRLLRIHEKPDAATERRLGAEARVSMNLWLLTPAILDACRAVPLSPRGELELPLAVQHAIDHGTHVHTWPVAASVLDLSQRADVDAVKGRLERVDVEL